MPAVAAWRLNLRFPESAVVSMLHQDDSTLPRLKGIDAAGIERLPLPCPENIIHENKVPGDAMGHREFENVRLPDRLSLNRGFVPAGHFDQS